MKVFISWSGRLSGQLAEVFHEWLPDVIQSVKPYLSSKDIDKGAKWDSDIAGVLKEAKICLIALTPDNLNSN